MLAHELLETQAAIGVVAGAALVAGLQTLLAAGQPAEAMLVLEQAVAGADASLEAEAWCQLAATRRAVGDTRGALAAVRSAGEGGCLARSAP